MRREVRGEKSEGEGCGGKWALTTKATFSVSAYTV